MKLLFDHHLSFRLTARLADLFPASSHVLDHGLDREQDIVLWEFARDNGFTLVTKDSDFSDLSTLHGFPPKVVWLRIGNCKTQEIEALLRQHHEVIADFETDDSIAILILT